MKLEKVKHFIFKCSNAINYYQGIESIFAAFVAYIAIIFITIQTCALKEQVRLTRGQLKATESSLKITNRELETSLMVTRPFLGLRPVVEIEKERTGICYETSNTGNVPARVVYSNFAAWIDGKALPREEKQFPTLSIIHSNIPYRGSCTMLIPHGNVNYKEALKFINEQGNCFEMSQCVVYGSVDEADPRRWKAEIRSILNEREELPTIHVDEKVVGKETIQCKIDPPQVCKKQ